jgi:hypothetical protein
VYPAYPDIQCRRLKNSSNFPDFLTFTLKSLKSLLEIAIYTMLLDFCQQVKLFPYFYWLTRETPAIPTEFARYGDWTHGQRRKKMPGALEQKYQAAPGTAWVFPA